MLQPDANLDIPSPYYRVSLKAIVFDDDNRLLVIQTQDGFWELPGGGWEHGESMQHCLRREMMEELCLGVKHIDFKRIYPYSSKGRTGHFRLKLAVPVTVQDYDVKISDPDIKAHRFVTPQQLAKLDMVDSESGIKQHIPRIWPG
ncbi:MAG TPA: NUDIX hydrolase [Candidatus Saccharimonadia bacterium]|nr:NUDIX hydrolase [Candidatus Saccharimonadia bacterium]